MYTIAVCYRKKENFLLGCSSCDNVALMLIKYNWCGLFHLKSQQNEANTWRSHRSLRRIWSDEPTEYKISFPVQIEVCYLPPITTLLRYLIRCCKLPAIQETWISDLQVVSTIKSTTYLTTENWYWINEYLSYVSGG